MATLVRPTTTRAVHLRITPRPSSLGESREILRLISQFGEVEHFKNLKYDALPAPNAAIVIFKEESAASHCLKRSPIRFRMGRAPTQQERNADEASHSAQEPGAALTDANSRIFQLQVNPARAHFRDLLNSSHYHGAFAIDTKSAAQQDLSKRVPLQGLSDINWKAEEKPWHIMNLEKERNGSFRFSGKRKTLQDVHAEGQSAG